MNPVVNRDLSKRVRPMSGISMAKQVVCFDIQFSAELIKALDDRIALYSKEADEEEKDQNNMEIDVSFSHISLATIFNESSIAH